MLFNTFVFQVGLVALLLERFRAMLVFSCLYLTFSIVLHSWLMVRGCATAAPRRYQPPSAVDLCLNTKTRRHQESDCFIYPWEKYHNDEKLWYKKKSCKQALITFISLKMFSQLRCTNLTCLYLCLQNVRWLNTNGFIWTESLQVLFVLQRTGTDRVLALRLSFWRNH